jgi:hypothetical protein
VTCRLQSTVLKAYDLAGQETNAIAVTTEVPASNGQVVTTLSVVFSNFTLTNPAGATASYECSLAGTDRTGASSIFTDSTPFPQFRVTPTPANLSGTFTW